MSPTKPRRVSDRATVPPEPSPRGAVAYRRPGETEGHAIARTLLNTEVDAAGTFDRWMHPPGFDPGSLDAKAGIPDFAAVLTSQAKAINDGDLSKVEAMLASQAQTLGMVFNFLTRQCAGQQALQLWEARMRVAMRAQNQCRMTLETLAEIKNPRPVAFVKQANISAGHQQVNNGVQPTNTTTSARAEEAQMPQTKLLTEGVPHDLDTRTSSTPGRADPLLATVGEVDRTEDSGGQGAGRAERMEGRHEADDARAGKGAARAARGSLDGRRRVIKGR